MRVLIDYRPALRERSGAGEYTHQLVKALTRQKALELTLFSSSWRDRLVPSSELPGVRIVDRRAPVSLLNFAWHRLGWPAAEWIAGGSYDVTHSSHPLILPARRAAHVITIHDLNFLRHPERTRGEVRRDYPALVRTHAHRADRIIVPSEFTAGEVEQQLGVDRSKIVVGPVGAPQWTPRTHPARDGYILFVGTLEPRKNVNGLLDAYEQLIAAASDGYPDLVLAGKVTDEALDWLKRIERPPLKGHVRQIGYVDPSRTRALYEGARLLVLPSFEEGFGIPVLEAMTAGVPVVASSRGSLPEVLGSAGVLVDPDRPEQIASGIARVVGDPSYAESCAARGLARSRLFQWSVTANRVFEAYRDAVEAHARRH